MISEDLLRRVREALPAGCTEKKMFGGLSFLKDGRMFCGILGDDLVVRVGSAAHDDALRQPHARAMDFTGRPMRGFVYVASPGLRTSAALSAWVERGLAGLADRP